MNTAALFCATAVALFLGAPSYAQPREIHHRIATSAGQSIKLVALTLDACSGAYDDALIQFLIRNKIPATLFVTKRWLNTNPFGVSVIKANLDLFEIENHGANHIPAVVGVGRKVYGIPGQPDMIHLQREVLEGAAAIEKAFGVHPHWYRGATAVYDPSAVDKINQLGFEVAGFSVNADGGATFSQRQIQSRLAKVANGDVIIAHMNKPKGDTAEAFSASLLQLVRQGFRFVRLNDVKLVEQ